MKLQPLRVLQGTLLYLPNTFLVPNAALAILALISTALYRPSIRREDWPYFLFVAGVMANALFGLAIGHPFPDSPFKNNGILGAAILVFAYLCARSLDDTVWRTVLVFLLIEAATIYIQFALHIRFFFPSQEDFSTLTEYAYGRDVASGTLWYYIRPEGLSNSSTVAGSKMLLGILIAYMLPMDRHWRWGLIAFLAGAVFLNFKRSGIVVLGLWAALLFAVDVIENGWHQRHNIVAAVAGVTLATYLGFLIAQMTREQALSLSELSSRVMITQLSGRAEIWDESLRFIRAHIFFGNFSERYTVGTGQYVHNSFMSLLATHGIFLASLLLAYYAAQVWRRPKTFVLLFPVFANAFFQEDLFWYISQFDLFLLYLLVQRQPSDEWLAPWRPRATRLPMPTDVAAYAR
jgi:hypothetical protein